MTNAADPNPRMPGTIEDFFNRTRRAFGRTWQPVVWLVALFVGVITAYGVIVLRLLIGSVQFLGFGVFEERLYTTAQTLDWWHVLLVPTLGGLVVGGLLVYGKRSGALPDHRAHSIADVMEARGLFGGRVSSKNGFMSAIISGVSLGAGASAGREGPAVHLGAALASFVAQRLRYPPITTRTMLACGAAAAVSASFNAPLAGVLFALEVILGHYALSVFAPIVIASVAATIVTRIHLGEFPAFIAPPLTIGSYVELPAFALLGLIAGLVAIVFLKSMMISRVYLQLAFSRFRIPIWGQPAIGGALIGLIGISFPQILGVGYEATDAALNGTFPIWLMLALIVAKIIATSITLNCRFGGGVFAPALFLGVMAGGTFGALITSLTPDLAASQSFYAVVGMGAVSAAILGAPISTTLIAFELVREYEVAIALLMSASIATILTQAVLGKSFFHWQIEDRGYRLQDGPHQAILQTTMVSDVMRETENTSDPLDPKTPALRPTDHLRTVFEMMDRHELDVIPVIDMQDDEHVIGLVTRADALIAYNKALVDANIEHHQ